MRNGVLLSPRPSRVDRRRVVPAQSPANQRENKFKPADFIKKTLHFNAHGLPPAGSPITPSAAMRKSEQRKNPPAKQMVQAILSSLLSWGIDSELDSISTKLGFVQPSTRVSVGYQAFGYSKLVLMDTLLSRLRKVFRWSGARLVS